MFPNTILSFQKSRNQWQLCKRCLVLPGFSLRGNDNGGPGMVSFDIKDKHNRLMLADAIGSRLILSDRFNSFDGGFIEHLTT